ncbi:MAG: hypothetical protein WC455_09570 [Dehalococcoidia bacterium]|jgi:hypothetical protein
MNRFDTILTKVAQGMVDPMMAGAGDGGMGMPMDPNMGMPAAPPPPPPTPEEAAAMAGQDPMAGMQNPMMPGLPPELMGIGMGGGEVDQKEEIIAGQAEAITSLSESVKALTDMHATIGSEPDLAAENIAATLAGSGALTGMGEEDFPPIDAQS